METSPDKDQMTSSSERGTASAEGQYSLASGTSSGGPPQTQQAVRFASQQQEIEPVYSLQSASPVPFQNPDFSQELSAEAREEIKSLSKNLQKSPLQQRRMSHFAFEPVSMPVSRFPSNESSPQNATREPTRSSTASGRPSPLLAASATPPLTPSSTHLRGVQAEITGSSDAELVKVHADPLQTSPSISAPRNNSPPTAAMDGTIGQNLNLSAPTSRPSSLSDQMSTRPTSLSQESSAGDRTQKPVPIFTLGPTDSSGDLVPSTSGSGPVSGAATPPAVYQRPLTPAADREDNPYARSKRPPQSKNLDAIDQRFVFGAKEARRRPGPFGACSSSLPRSSSGNDLKTQHKHQSTFSLHSLGSKKDHLGSLQQEGSSVQGSKSQGSMSELKRFFGLTHRSKRSRSPLPTQNTGTRTPPNQRPPSNVPFADDHGLEEKWGKFGKVLGSGAGGSVRLMKRSSDGVTFAVKQFRDRHSYETEREYAKKVTAEFCIGSTLHHGNIIETLDIVHEKGHWYEVMEYAPFDLFAIVMTGKMSREEVNCSFVQIVSGVNFLHSMGLAHRDLKLDNVVVNEHGIMKIIDFGSASVFRYPFENDIVLASGIVGSDPYLAPEVYDGNKYDPRFADIWSLAIIFACMSLRRFPWKAPRLTDNSYKLFASPPSAGAPPADGPRRSFEGKSKPALEMTSAAAESPSPAPAPTSLAGPVHNHTSDDGANKHYHHHHNHHNHHHREKVEESVESQPEVPAPKSEVIKGPWRLLRLLPRETRNIIGKMLELEPEKRATLEELLGDPWVANTPVCSQLEGGRVITAPGHEHTLVPSNTSQQNVSYR